MEDTPAIDPRWLASRMRRQGHSHPFETIEYEFVGRFSTDVWRLRLVGGLAVPQLSLILKRPYQASRTGEPADLEVAFYQRVADSLSVLAPSFIGQFENCLIISELPELQPFDFRTGPTPEHAGLVMEGLAELHASRWNEVSDLDWIPDLSDPVLRKAWQVDFDIGWKTNRSRFHELCPSFTSIGDALVGRLADAVEPLSTPKTLLHGDSHGENLPMSSARAVAFLDWQSPRLGNPGFDTSIFTTMSYPVRVRRQVEQALVESHLQSICAREIHWPDPWADYRLGVLRRAARIVEISATQKLSSLSWVFERCATAAVDHRVLDLVA